MQTDKYIAKEIAFLTQVINNKHADAFCYKKRGEYYLNIGEYDKAIKDISKSIRLGRNSPLDYLYRGKVYDSNCEYDKAIADFTEAIKLIMEQAFNNIKRREQDNTWWDGFTEAHKLREDAYQKLAAADLQNAKELGYSGTQD